MKTTFLAIAAIVICLVAADPARADHRRRGHVGWHYHPSHGYHYGWHRDHRWEYPGYSYRYPSYAATSYSYFYQPRFHPLYQPYYPGMYGFYGGYPYGYSSGGISIPLGRRGGIWLNFGR